MEEQGFYLLSKLKEVKLKTKYKTVVSDISSRSTGEWPLIEEKQVRQAPQLFQLTVLRELPGNSAVCMWGFPTCCLAGFLSRETRLQSFKLPRYMEFVRESIERGHRRSAEGFPVVSWVLSSTCMWGNYLRPEGKQDAAGKTTTRFVKNWEWFVFPLARLERSLGTWAPSRVPSRVLLHCSC